jgi:predicted RNase H-like HicB family nuclease
MKEFLIIIEKTPTGYSAYVPDLPGCIATGDTKRTVRKNMREAIEFHLQGMREEELPVPRRRSETDFVKVGV